MTDDTITISAGRPNRQGDAEDFTGPDGTYPVILSSISDPFEADSRFSKSGKDTYRLFTFAFENDENLGEVLDKRVRTGSTGPKSTQFEIIAALLGRTPAVGESVKLPELVGRGCLAKIVTNDNDWPTIASLMAAPKTAAAQAMSASIASRQSPAPAAPPSQPVAEAAPMPF